MYLEYRVVVFEVVEDVLCVVEDLLFLEVLQGDVLMVDIGYKDLVYKVFVLDWWFLGEMFVDWLNKEVLVMLSVGLI